MSEKIFAKGIRFDRPREGAPEFVKGRLSFNVDEAIAFLKEHKDKRGWVNLDLLKSKEKGTLYLVLNEWKKPESMLTDEEKKNIETIRENAKLKAQEINTDEAYNDF